MLESNPLKSIMLVQRLAAAPLHSMLYYAILCYTILYYYYAILYYTILLLYYAILCYTILCYTMLYYAILYYYYTILYYTILYYTILYYTILYYRRLAVCFGSVPSGPACGPYPSIRCASMLGAPRTNGRSLTVVWETIATSLGLVSRSMPWGTPRQA